jgi:Fe(3+) dicitrate transport protein
VKTIATFLGLLLSTIAIGQTGTGGVRGKVIDNDTYTQLHDVNVRLKGTSFATATDRNGAFALNNIPAGSYTLEATSVGFEPSEAMVEIRPGEETTLRLVLRMKVIEMPQIAIFTDRDGIFSDTPGSVTYIDKKEINRIDPVSGNEVLRRVPGLHVVDEEGAGLRVNIGIRGLDPDRSRGVLVLEDGIPVALSPYGEPEMYYTPAIDRMAGVEVVKGSGQIMYGPQTIGGVVNYITADPPAREQGSVSLRGGEGGFFTGRMSYGNTYGKAGIQVNYLRKQVDDLGMLSYRINDFSSKFRMELSERGSIGLKLGVYDESSNATYIGLPQTMFDAGGNDFTRLAPDDQLKVRRYSVSATHKHTFSPSFRLTTTGYAYTTTRDWRRQDFVENSFDAEGNLNPPPGNHTGVTWGDESIEDGAIYMRNSSGNRNRSFEVVGAESKITKTFLAFGKESELNVGVRYLFERAFEQRVDGASAAASVGVIREDEVRTGFALSGFAHNQTRVSDRFTLTAGVRVEQFDYERDIRRRRFSGVITDTSLVAGSGLVSVIPGAGFNYNVNEYVGVFGGIHRGFAPPRIKDAVSGDGEPYALDAELSWNAELGSRGRLPNGIGYEFTAFYMDFSNQVIPVSESSGGVGSGVINGGATQHYGVELGINAELNTLFNFDDLLLLSVSATYVEASFSSDRFIGGEQTGVNIAGNRTPYAPELYVSSAITYEASFGLGARLTSTYVSDQFTDVVNTIDPSPNGRIGRIPAYHLLDGGLTYRLSKINTLFSITVKNITNERVIVTRRPQGIRVGLPRFITAGVTVNF